MTMVVCETRDVRVRAHGDQRFLQFRGGVQAGQYAWRNNEAIVNCVERVPNEDCAVREHHVSARATDCEPCPCTPQPQPPWSMHGFGYVHVMFNSLTAHDPRCRGSATPEQPRFRLLQIGLGGGTFPRHARQTCGAVVDVIEGQEDVAMMAQRYFGYNPQRGGGRIIVADGLDGLRQLAGGAPYDGVAIDCMIQGSTPPTCKSAEFVRRVATLTKPSGHVVQWAWGSDRMLLRAAYTKHFHNFTDRPYGGVGAVLHIRGRKRGVHVP